MQGISLLAAFQVGSALGWLVVVAAARLRHHLYALFAGVVLGVHTALSVLVARQAGPLLPLFAALQVTVYVHFLSLARPRLRPWIYRVLVSQPASFHVAGTFLSWPVLIATAFGAPSWWLGLPWLVAATGLYHSLSTRREVVELTLGAPALPAEAGVRRLWPHPQRSWSSVPPTGDAAPLRIIQLTDTHLGPFMTVARLRAIVERAVARDPDLVFLTGDFLTMESQADPAHLTAALAPLAALPGRVFACHGNHDHEAPRVVHAALASAGVELLVDRAVVVETRRGPVQILGLDFHFRGRVERMAEAVRAFPRRANLPRLVLLHDPGAFRHLPEGEGDLVFSGHTHGGQLGLVALGLPHTFVSLVTSIPDHGLWGRGPDRLYVHRGTGHYGFPLRLGVPAEESELWLRW